MIYLCPGCGKQIASDTKICPFCQCDIVAADARSYPERLIGSLHHPGPETRLRAAKILGQQRYAPAVGPLLARAREELQQERRDIPFLAALLRSARLCGARPEEWQPLMERGAIHCCGPSWSAIMSWFILKRRTWIYDG